MRHGKPVLRIALVVMTRPRAMATIFRTGRGGFEKPPGFDACSVIPFVWF